MESICMSYLLLIFFFTPIMSKYKHNIMQGIERTCNIFRRINKAFPVFLDVTASPKCYNNNWDIVFTSQNVMNMTMTFVSGMVVHCGITKYKLYD